MTKTKTIYEIRRLGCCSWSEHTSLWAARTELRAAERIVQGHRIFAIHPDGRIEDRTRTDDGRDD